MYYAPVSHLRFTQKLAEAQLFSDLIAQATTPAYDLDLHHGDRAYMSHDEHSGFVVRANGELCAVFSCYAGRGAGIVCSAIRRGATHLDCFDGFLPTFYAKHGFVEVCRVQNYNGAHLPSVIYMSVGGINGKAIARRVAGV